MAHLTGTFSHPLPGRLRVTLTGDYFVGTTRRGDGGFPSVPASGDDNYVVRAFVGPADDLAYTAPIDRFAAAAQVELDYPGGGLVWVMGTETVSFVSAGGFTANGIQNLKLAGRLLLR